MRIELNIRVAGDQGKPSGVVGRLCYVCKRSHKANNEPPKYKIGSCPSASQDGIIKT
ncbi:MULTISPECIES: hypothetical protein [unclassified Paenibacillus]|uniref:hypothetical protein n=1 Tax=unclassified Paenibacillus TaxID=185978 RepID=UPI0012FAD7F3|nr:MULTISPECIES: hypothetical protein [unclassified Paenibacillus]